MELKDILRDILKRDYGIETDAQLMQAIREQKPLDIGIFRFAACKPTGESLLNHPQEV